MKLGPPNEKHAQPRAFDAIVVGSGKAGFPLAGRLTKKGHTVAIIERDHFGGTCVNTGCTPTKTMAASAYVARLGARAMEYGVEIASPPRVDLAAVRARADAIVIAHRGNIERTLRGLDGCNVFRGHARFERQMKFVWATTPFAHQGSSSTSAAARSFRICPDWTRSPT